MTQPGQRLSMQQWSALLDRQTTVRLDEIRAKEGWSRAEVIRQVVATYLAQQREAPL